MDTTENAVARAKQLVESGQYAAALPVLRAHLDDHPEDAQAWHRLAGALIGADDWPAAIEAADRALAIEPDNGIAYRMRAVADLSLQRWPDLRDDAREAVRLRPDDVEALTLLAFGLIQADRDTAQARTLLRQARKLDPEHPAVRRLDQHFGPAWIRPLLLAGPAFGVAGFALLAGLLAFSPSRTGELEHLVWTAIAALGLALLPLLATIGGKYEGIAPRPRAVIAAAVAGAVAAGVGMGVIVGLAGQALAVAGVGLVLALLIALRLLVRRRAT
ncbi:tetratricopeptide repeat protein [Actinoplanes sp. NPDC048791]|uniref:tetratricopeptide repeat protein n=1 Tax=Actinoplanes sp. NPDC048791 TaxID=3154623 RepID=UPI0033FB5501